MDPPWRPGCGLITHYATRADWGDASLVIFQNVTPRPIGKLTSHFTIYRRRDGSPCRA